MPKIFISFATEDEDFVVTLFSRLKDLGAEIWDYSNRAEEIQLGESIHETLRLRIAESDYFIPIVTINSISPEKKCIHFEVSQAVENRKRCIPIILPYRSPGPTYSWPGAFQFISDRKYLEMDPENRDGFEEGIFQLCEDLELTYKAGFIDHQKLPLYERLQAEIKPQLNVIKGLKGRNNYYQFITPINRFNYNYQIGKWKESLESIVLFISICKNYFPTLQMYYPWVVKGVCELQLGILTEAEKTLSALTNHEKADENAFGGLALVLFEQGNLKESLRLFKMSLLKCPEGEEIEAIYNIVSAAVEIVRSQHEKPGDPTALSDAMEILNNRSYVEALSLYNRGNAKEILRIQYMVALCFLFKADYPNACSRMKFIYENKIFSIDAKKQVSDFQSTHVSRRIHNFFFEQGFLVPLDSEIRELNSVESDKKCWLIIDGPSLYYLVFNHDLIDVYYREPSLIIHLTDVLTILNQQVLATEILQREADILQSKILYQRLAILACHAGRLTNACEIYCEKLCVEPIDKQFMIEYALICKRMNNLAAMKNACEKTLASGRPKEARDFYYQGFANFLLGNHDTAKAYYLDSGPYDTPYIKQTSNY